MVTFEKTLEKNDIGTTGSHQAGIHIPKSNLDLIAFLPLLNEETKNPDSWIECIDQDNRLWNFRYIHYNNKHHDQKGTRDEYRLTHIRSFLKAMNAKEGDKFCISKNSGEQNYQISITRDKVSGCETQTNSEKVIRPETQPNRLKLRGWNRAH